jgi:hypothetical protein
MTFQQQLNDMRCQEPHVGFGHCSCSINEVLNDLTKAHAEAVKAAWYEGWNNMALGSWRVPYMAWDASEAKAALEGDHE